MFWLVGGTNLFNDVVNRNALQWSASARTGKTRLIMLEELLFGGGHLSFGDEVIFKHRPQNEVAVPDGRGRMAEGRIQTGAIHDTSEQSSFEGRKK